MCMDNVLTSACCPASASCHYCAALCCLCITGLHNGMNTSTNSLFKLNFQDLLVFIKGSFPIGSTLVACIADKFTWWSHMLSNVSCIHLYPFFFFFFLCWSSLSAIDVCLLSSVTTKVNLSLQSLLDQLWWWLTLCRSADVSLGFPFLVQTGPLIGPSMYCQHQNPYSSQPCNSQYYSITCTTHYSAIIDSTNPVKFPNPANLTVRPEKLALVSCLPSFYPGWSWLAAHMIYELA